MPRQNKIHRYVLITKKQAMIATFNKDAHDGIITIPIERIAINNKEHRNILNTLTRIIHRPNKTIKPFVVIFKC